jgi:DNA-binding response OmpR family regulator
MTLKLLVADDETDIAEVVAFGARMNWPGCQVVLASSGAEALERFADEAPDLVVLDVSMPPPDGFEVCRRIREESDVPILMLTVRRNTLDKVRALDFGADDYLTKPFDHLELLARLRALYRRATVHLPVATERIVSGDLSIDFARREVRVRGEPRRFTHTEFRMLEELVRQAGFVVPHQVLLDRVWGPEWIGDTSYLKVYIRRLRQKLGDDAERPRYIQTEWGVGYRFVPPSNPET